MVGNRADVNTLTKTAIGELITKAIVKIPVVAASFIEFKIMYGLLLIRDVANDVISAGNA